MKRIHLGNAPVDSGMLMIADPCYVLTGDVKPDAYQQACAQFVGEILLTGIAGNGVIHPTRYGDGLYPVYAEFDDDGLLDRLVVEFI